MNQPPNGRRVSTLLVFLFLCFSACGSPDTASQAGAGSSRPTPSPPSNPSVNSGQDVTEPDNDSSAVNDQEDASDQTVTKTQMRKLSTFMAIAVLMIVAVTKPGTVGRKSMTSMMWTTAEVIPNHLLKAAKPGLKNIIKPCFSKGLPS